MSLALDDLKNRINSNTLTALQQAALATALTVISPAFLGPDESASVLSVNEEPLAREWMAVLYTINSEGTGGGSGVLPTNQTVWHINPLTGNDLNDGLTAPTALATVAQLALRWKGVGGGGRPQLSPSVGTTITIFVDADLPASDPIAPLLDVDLSAGMSLNFVGAAKPPAKTSTFTAASTFARTLADGQQTFTDASVADFNAFIGTAMLINCTAGPRLSVAWLVGPDPGASATGTSSVFYTPQVQGTPSVPTIVQPLAADGYTLSAPTVAFLGSGFTTRQFPQQPQTGAAFGANVTFYRLHFPIPGDANDTALLTGMNGVGYFFQECQLDETLTIDGASSSATFTNCLAFHSGGYIANGGATLELFAGAASLGTTVGGPLVNVTTDAVMIVDADFALISMNNAFTASFGGVLELGNASHWGTTAGASLVAVDSGVAVLNPLTQATSVLYGTDGGQFAIVGAGTNNGQSRLTYHQTGSGTPAADQFKSTNVAFLLGRGPSTSAWGVSTTTGLAVGATTNTIAHLDAAIGAGTGFGSNAVDPASMSYLAVAA